MRKEISNLDLLKFLNVIDYFHNKIYKEENKFISIPNIQKNKVKKFLERDVVQISSLFSVFWYLSFQYNYWENKNIKNDFDLSWILGKKAIDRWNNSENNNYFEYRLNDKYKIKYVEVEKILFPDRYKNTKKINFEEKNDFHRALYYNTIRGLTHCIDNTDLYERGNQFCDNCVFQKRCRIFLRKNYPKLYKEKYG